MRLTLLFVCLSNRAPWFSTACAAWLVFVSGITVMNDVALYTMTSSYLHSEWPAFRCRMSISRRSRDSLITSSDSQGSPALIALPKLHASNSLGVEFHVPASSGRVYAKALLLWTGVTECIVQIGCVVAPLSCDALFRCC